jgi:hypothetical protein
MRKIAGGFPRPNQRMLIIADSRAHSMIYSVQNPCFSNHFSPLQTEIWVVGGEKFYPK